MPQKSPAEEIIGRCGGTRKLARALPQKNGRPFPASTVQSWKDAGLIPAKHMRDVIDAAASLGKTVIPQDFIEAPGEDVTRNFPVAAGASGA